MVTLYDFENGDLFINSQYGLVRYREWLIKEKERIEQDKSRTAEIVIRGTAWGLFVNEVDGCRCPHCLRKYPDSGRGGDVGIY